MVATTTENLHDLSTALDARPLPEAAEILAEGQRAAAAAIGPAIPSICGASEAMAETIRSGGRLHYVAAGSSGLMAAADAMELGGTFSIPSQQVRIHMAGGLPTGSEMPGDVEDDVEDLSAGLPADMRGDCLIAVSASGSTPYTLEAIKLGRDRGARIIGIANNRGAQLLVEADFPILLETPPEVLSGSTRMGAGTAQKIALNMLSTLMALQLGHIHDGMMVNLRADNAKLRKRARSIVSTIAQVSDPAAQNALDQTAGNVKRAILCAKGATDAHAHDLLVNSGGHLRPAINALENE